MTSKSWISWLGAGLIALALIVAPPTPMVHAVGNAHKVSVVSFGLFGDQDVFRSEATGAAQVVAGRFGRGPINVNNATQKKAEAQRSKAWPWHCKLQPMAWTPRTTFCLLFSPRTVPAPALQSKRDGSHATAHAAQSRRHAGMTGVRHKVVVISRAIQESLSLVSRTPMCS